MKRMKLTNHSATTSYHQSQSVSTHVFIICTALVIGVHVDPGFAGLTGVNIVGIDLLPPDYTNDNPPPTSCLVPVCLDLEFEFEIVTECGLCAGTEGPEMHIVALDCNGHVVAEDHRSFPPTSPCDGPPAITIEPITGVDFSFSACSGNSLIRRVDVFTALDHITTRPSLSDCSTPSQVKWNENPAASFAIPPPDMTCSLTNAELDCFTCPEIKPLPLESLVIYKSQRSLYGISTTDDSGASFGEVVNGSFTAPGPGLLFIETLTPSPSVSTWSATISGTNFIGGWCTQTGRTGSPLSGQQCYETSISGQSVDFHIRVGRIDSSFDYNLKFTWIASEDRGCCFERAEETLTFHVLPFSDASQSSDTSIPTRRQWVRHDGSVDYEMTTPLCNACTGGGCHTSNMSAPFIAWPTLDGTVIREGHAQGWSITPSSIKTPGPQSTLYNY